MARGIINLVIIHSFNQSFSRSFVSAQYFQAHSRYKNAAEKQTGVVLDFKLLKVD